MIKFLFFKLYIIKLLFNNFFNNKNNALRIYQYGIITIKKD